MRSDSAHSLRRRPATMGDVAKRAGVSPQTVSRVVNSRDYVGGDTRERVLRAMRELNYRPNRAAQALVTGRTKTLGVISMDSVAFGPVSILLGLERAAHAHGYSVSIARLGSLDRESLTRALEQLQRESVEGILLNAAQDRITQELDHRVMDVPVVAVEDTLDATVSVVAVDQVAGAAAARSRPPERLAHRRPERLVGGAESGRGMAQDAGVGRGAGGACALRRLEPAIGL
jgi:DNA-binding LacI/PurR family transcriptional regulator